MSTFEHEPIPDTIDVSEDGTITETYEIAQIPVDLDSFTAVQAHSFGVGYLVNNDDEVGYFLEFHNNELDIPLRVVIDKSLLQRMVVAIMDTVDTVENEGG